MQHYAEHHSRQTHQAGHDGARDRNEGDTQREARRNLQNQHVIAPQQEVCHHTPTPETVVPRGTSDYQVERRHLSR